jgi:hypothetical protein
MTVANVVTPAKTTISLLFNDTALHLWPIERCLGGRASLLRLGTVPGVSI